MWRNSSGALPSTWARAEAIAVSSCTTALHLALVAAGVRPGDEVLCPSLSFIATANAIVYAGAKPVFVDIEPFTFNIDPSRIESSITPRTKAILVVHQIGLPCALREISEIASRHGLIVVEDAACAIGSEYEGKRIGSPYSSMACFSFHPRKILTTGEGGMITTADSDAAARMRRLRQHAMNVSDLARHGANQVVFESYDEVGYNYRMTDLQAGARTRAIGAPSGDAGQADARWLCATLSGCRQSLGWSSLLNRTAAATISSPTWFGCESDAPVHARPVDAGTAEPGSRVA